MSGAARERAEDPVQEPVQEPSARPTPLRAQAEVEAAAAAREGAAVDDGEGAAAAPAEEPAVVPVRAAAPGRPTRARAASPARRRPRATGRASAAGDPDRAAAVLAEAAEAGERVVEELEHAARAGRLAAAADASALEDRLAAALALLRRRLTGDYVVDEFGFDAELTEQVLLAVVRPIYRRWFRVEVRGVEHVPAEGGGLVVANHSGTIAWDAVMTQVAVHDEHPAHRHLRLLGADVVFSTPVVGELARKSGATLAANADAERLLRLGHVVGVWPEGFKGIGKPFRDRYKLQRFGRGGFVSAALRTGSPIVPCAIVGAEEVAPILADVPVLARLLGVPYVPITPTFPWLGPLGLVPLPSKWLIEFGEPVETAHLPEGAAEDPMLVFDLTDAVRETIQRSLHELLVQRRSVFF